MPPVLRIYGFGGFFFFFFRGEGGRKERDVKTAKMDCRKKKLATFLLLKCHTTHRIFRSPKFLDLDKSEKKFFG